MIRSLRVPLLAVFATCLPATSSPSQKVADGQRAREIRAEIVRLHEELARLDGASWRSYTDPRDRLEAYERHRALADQSPFRELRW